MNSQINRLPHPPSSTHPITETKPSHKAKVRFEPVLSESSTRPTLSTSLGRDSSSLRSLSEFTGLRLSYLNNRIVEAAVHDTSQLSPSSRPCHRCSELNENLYTITSEVMTQYDYFDAYFRRLSIFVLLSRS